MVTSQELPVASLPVEQRPTPGPEPREVWARERFQLGPALRLCGEQRGQPPPSAGLPDPHQQQPEANDPQTLVGDPSMSQAAVLRNFRRASLNICSTSRAVLGSWSR